MTSLPLPGATGWRLPPDPPPALVTFLEQALPTLLRRLALWKGLVRDRHQDVIEDLLQELWLDYLLNTEQLLAMTQEERHLRWFRLLARSHYRWREQGQKHLGGEKLADLVHEPPAGDSEHCLGRLRAHERQLLARLENQACYLKNGRLNTQETARRLRVSPQTLRRLWEQVAEATGFGNSFVDFWCRRLGEALASLGLGLLRDQQGQDPGDCRRHMCRIRRIRARLCQRPLPVHLRRLLARYRRGRHPDLAQVLADAASLRPKDRATRLLLLRTRLRSREGEDGTGATTAARPAAPPAEPAPVRGHRRSPSGRARQAG